MAPAAVADLYPGQTAVREQKQATVQASVLTAPKQLHLEYRHLSDPAPGELQISVLATGICGSDVAYYKNFRNGDLKAVAPLTLGHESAGVVEAIGDGVSGFCVGDRVALEVGVPCDNCRACQRGRYNLCPKMRFRSSAKSIPHFQGTLQERINHPAKWCYKIPESVSLEAAALLEPLSVAIHSTRRASIEQGDTVIVFGAGSVGLLVAAMAKLSGATTVVIVDINAERVKYALDNNFATKGYVALHSGHSERAETTVDHFEEARTLASGVVSRACADETDAEGADVTFDCTGKEVCMQAGLYATRPGGQLIMVGMGTPIQTLQMSAAHLKEVDILGVFRYANTYPTGIKLLASGALPRLDNMITHRFQGLAQVRDAFELASKQTDREGNLVLKVLIEP
ncbi:GroES-like protein [Venturia nashicola]|uniref:GroES-like protein n=1 Tax=Venturia nashicola TaxID=86259 RepID=A0A4Z1NQ79_9PEZI|nr:GroES-like protein [Venturia nashicola]